MGRESIWILSLASFLTVGAGCAGNRADCGESGRFGGAMSQACGLILDDFQYSQGTSTTALGIAKDGSGNIVVAGSALDTGGIYHWLIRHSGDNGATWTTVKDYQLINAQDAEPTGGQGDVSGHSVYVDTRGYFYSVGYAKDASTIPQWTVLQSTDGGNTWNVVDQAAVVGKKNEALTVTGDASGAVYVAGYQNASGTKHHYVKKSVDGGVTWSTVDGPYQYASGNDTETYAAFVDAAGNYYFAGRGSTGSGAHWIVNEITSGGTVIHAGGAAVADDFVLVSGFNSFATTMNQDSSGNLYVMGRGLQNSSLYDAVLRRFSPLTSNWSTINDYEYASGFSTVGRGLLVDSAGELLYGGIATDGAGIQHGLIRKSTDSGSTWTTVDDYQYAPAQNTVAESTLLEGRNVLVAETGTDSAGSTHWLVRRYFH